MPSLLNPQHELVAQERAAGESAVEACRVALAYAKMQPANCRKLCNRADVKARVKEIQAAAAARAEITAEWLMMKLKRRVDLVDQFNVDDYLTKSGKGQPRFIDISQATRE